jgi:type IX secretion system PorP/SprF family membrane protein
MPTLYTRLTKNILRTTVFLIFLCTRLVGQQSPQLSLYSENSVYLNPALSGLESNSFVQLHYRNQWTGYNTSSGNTGSLGTQILSFSNPAIFKIIGISGYLLNDKVPSGAGQIQGVIQGSVNKSIGDGKLSLGIGIGLNRRSLDGRNYIYRDPNDSVLDPYLNQTVSSEKIIPGLGIAYGNETYQFGVSYNSLAALQVHGNYNLYLGNEIELNPNLLIRYYQGKILAQPGFRLNLNQTIWFGGSYRLGDAAIGMVGLNLKDNKLNLGYSLDYTLINQIVKAPLSHEVFIRFNLPKFEKKVKWTPVKTPRFNYILTQ